MFILFCVLAAEEELSDRLTAWQPTRQPPDLEQGLALISASSTHGEAILQGTAEAAVEEEGSEDLSTKVAHLMAGIRALEAEVARAEEKDRQQFGGAEEGEGRVKG